MLGLAARGLSENTIVVALGDHGEGFGNQGVRQHDSNFFEEGLRVPVVLAGPRIAPRVATQAANLLDLLPTLLDALELPYAADALPGQSYLNGDPPASPKLFGCWFDRKCRGFVEGSRNIVESARTRRSVHLRSRGRLWGEGAAPAVSSRPRTLEAVNERIAGLQSRTLPRSAANSRPSAPGTAPWASRVLHPASPAGGLHGQK